jgi:hypothetical protein
MTDGSWSVIATFASGFEADLAIAMLEASGIPSFRDSHDASGIFGPGFQGATAQGVTVSVPSDLLDEARAAITLVDGGTS